MIDLPDTGCDDLSLVEGKELLPYLIIISFVEANSLLFWISVLFVPVIFAASSSISVDSFLQLIAMAFSFARTDSVEDIAFADLIEFVESRHILDRLSI